MKIQKVEPDNRRRRFEVATRRGVLAFPYARCEPAPSPDDRPVEVFVDAELGRAAITYRLASGPEGSIHVDSVLHVNADPDYLPPPHLSPLTLATTPPPDASGLAFPSAIPRLGPRPTPLP